MQNDGAKCQNLNENYLSDWFFYGENKYDPKS